MTIKSLFTLLFIAAAIGVNAQSLLSTEIVDSTTIVSASASNLNIMLRMQSKDWEDELTKLGYGSRSTSRDNHSGLEVFLSKKINNSGCIQTVTKTEVSIIIDYSGSNIPDQIFKKLKAELKPYYKGVLGESSIYQIKENGHIYQYDFIKYEGGETVSMMRH